MSLSTDVLTRATPTRLICRAGRWVLELTRLEAVDRDVFQPRLQRLEGSESILAMLRRSDDGQLLANAAAQLMRSARNDEDRAFDVNEGDWVPSAEMPALGRAPQVGAPEGADLALALTELRAELMVLRASHSRLRDRVAALEASQSGVGAANARLPRGSRSRRRSEPPGPLTEAANIAAPLAENPGFAATQASAGLGVLPLATPAPRVSTPPPADSAPPSPGQTFEEMAQSLRPAQLPPVLGLPTIHALSECLGTLMEQAPPISKASEHAFASLVKPHACKLLDDDGRERGIVLMDLTAAVMLGAALLSLPREEAQRQVSEDDASEDALLATSEICNNLTGPVNAVTGNAHVRSTALASVDVGELPKARARLDLSVEGGKVIVAMF